jgi:hypothetical protein
MKPKSPTFAKKATLGAAATGVVFGLQHHADAAVIYSGVQNITASVGAGLGTDEANLDFNIAPGIEFSIFVKRDHGLDSTQHGSVGIRGLGYNAVLSQFSMAKQMAPLSAISASAGGFIGGGLAGILHTAVNNAAGAGQWDESEVGIAGLKIVNGANTYYGWVRLAWADTDDDVYPNTLTAIDWAYNDTPGAAILAGDTGAVPEPSRALLALAGLGAMALRRRRKAA